MFSDLMINHNVNLTKNAVFLFLLELIFDENKRGPLLEALFYFHQIE